MFYLTFLARTNWAFQAAALLLLLWRRKTIRLPILLRYSIHWQSQRKRQNQPAVIGTQRSVNFLPFEHTIMWAVLRNRSYCCQHSHHRLLRPMCFHFRQRRANSSHPPPHSAHFHWQTVVIVEILRKVSRQPRLWAGIHFQSTSHCQNHSLLTQPRMEWCPEPIVWVLCLVISAALRFHLVLHATLHHWQSACPTLFRLP